MLWWFTVLLNLKNKKMKKNEDLQKDVQDAIKWEPLLNAAEIGVTVKDGVVTLTGTVDSYVKKLEAEEAAKKVLGVKAVVEKIEIHFANNSVLSDNDIADSVLKALDSNWKFPAEKLKVKVESGWVTLEGVLEWNFQREAARKSVKNLVGVKGVNNGILIQSETHDEIEKKDIESAFERNWSLDEKDIHIKVSGNRVTLNGKVHSIYQKDEAARIAWNAPGVSELDNELVIEHKD